MPVECIESNVLDGIPDDDRWPVIKRKCIVAKRVNLSSCKAVYGGSNGSGDIDPHVNRALIRLKKISRIHSWTMFCIFTNTKQSGSFSMLIIALAEVVDLIFLRKTNDWMKMMIVLKQTQRF